MTEPIPAPVVDANGEQLPPSVDGPPDFLPITGPPVALLPGEERAPDGGVHTQITATDDVMTTSPEPPNHKE